MAMAAIRGAPTDLPRSTRWRKGTVNCDFGQALGVEMSLTVIACDESASEGENLIASQHPVFVHGSTSLPLSDAQEFIARLRVATRAQAPEMKSGSVLTPRNRAALLDALPALDGQANIYFVDKSYFITAKMIVLTLAELGERNGQDVHLSGLGRYLTDLLHRKGPRAVGRGRWDALLLAFNDVIRSYARAGSKAASVWPFFVALANARMNCSDRQVSEILTEVWEARHLTLEHVNADPVEFRELDPLAPSLATVSMTWHMRLGVPFEFLHDRHSLLTESVRDAIVAGARAPLSLGEHALPRADLRGIRVIDSRLDARVQVADILAGTGREVAQMAAGGTLDDPLQTVVHEMLDFNVMSSGGSPVDLLVERAPLRYWEDWWARQAPS
ncbi:hypothetical protein [Microbacterium sp. NPDC058389]|uniref:hypothetical protein n=1 Tax=Microbacterium sp. NPDC058389 TaxID=3346475 RepID=UPI00364B1788